MALATLSIDLEMRLAKLEQGLNQAAQKTERAAAQIEGRLSKIGGALRGAGGALAVALPVAGLVAFAQRTIQGLDALNDLSDATGASIENLSALEDIAARTGTSFDAVGASVVKFNQVLASAKPGSEAEAAIRALGLSVAELKAEDPAEALRRVAVALAGFADDGNKARLVQELFGKSVREVAPFLKDLAEAGQLNATVTTEQAKEAERLNQQLAALSKNTTDLGRSLASITLPLVNRLTGALAQQVQGIEAARQAFGGYSALYSAGIRTLLDNGGSFASAAEGVQFYTEKIEALNAELQNLGSAGRIGPFNRAVDPRRAERIQAELADLQRYVDFYKRMRQIETAGQTFEPDPYDARFMRRPSLPGGGGGRGGGKGGKATRPMNPIFDLGSFEDIQDVDVANARERIAERTREIAEAEKARADQLKRIDDLIGRSAAMKELEDLKLIDDAYFSGAITAEEFARAQERVYQGLQLLPDVTKPATEALSEFGKQAQRNIQDAIGGTLFDTFMGRFDQIGERFRVLILQMVAQAAAAKLADALFGGGVGGGGGLVGQFVGSLFGGSRALGGPVAAGVPYLVGESGPEVFRPATAGTILPNRALGGPTFTQVVNIGGGVNRSELVAAMQAASAQAEARILDAMRRGRM